VTRTSKPTHTHGDEDDAPNRPLTAVAFRHAPTCQQHQAMTLAPQIALLFALTTGVGWLMILAGIGKHSLDWRRGRRVCPGCGRERTDRGCGCD
jgi:hypothetical protein